MATSKYFNYTNHKGTQRLIEDLVQEMIEQRGVDVKYIPRSILDKDPILNEVNHKFDDAIDLEVYIEEYIGANSMMWEKFGGLTMQDEVKFTISRRRFAAVIASSDANDQTPQEGDLIYLPLSAQIYKVNICNDDENFLQFGKYYTYEITCTLFEYGNEDLNTGYKEVDDIDRRLRALDDDEVDVGMDSLLETDNALDEIILDDIAPNKTSLDFGD